MLIRTQSKEAIAEVSHIYLSEMMGEKSFYIFGTCTGHSMFSSSKITLGIYKSKDDALRELDNLEKFFEKNTSGLYKMN